VRIKRNTILGKLPNSINQYGFYSINLSLGKDFDQIAPINRIKPFQVEFAANILETPTRLNHLFSVPEKALGSGEAEWLFTKIVEWRENGNLYTFDDRDLVVLTKMSVLDYEHRVLQPTLPLKTSSDLKRFWESENIDSQRGLVRFQGEDRIAASR